MMGSDKFLLNVVLSADINKNLILELRAIVTEKDSRSRVRTNQIRNNGMSHSHCGLVRQWNQDDKTAEVIDTNKEVDRALAATSKGPLGRGYSRIGVVCVYLSSENKR